MDEQLLETRMKYQHKLQEGSNFASCVRCFTPDQAHREPSAKPDLQCLLISRV